MRVVLVGAAEGQDRARGADVTPRNRERLDYAYALLTFPIMIVVWGAILVCGIISPPEEEGPWPPRRKGS